ncbi:hypothetical protein Mame01_40320 [Microbispora amethystogenes]|nr:hypothetical protein Mame01_40320 [Microbispora amethystogenes]
MRPRLFWVAVLAAEEPPASRSGFVRAPGEPPRTAGRLGNKEARMDVLDSLVDEELRLEFVLIEALHQEAERLAAPAVR